MSARLPMFAIALFTMAVFAGYLVGQDGEQILRMMPENARLLRQYTFKQRVEILYQGEERATRVNQVRFDVNGNRQLTMISETGGGEDAGGLGARLIARRRAEIKEYAQRVSDLLDHYLPPDPEKIRAALNSPTVVRLSNPVRISLKNFYQPGDELTLTLDSSARTPRMIDIKTELDNEAVSINAAFTDVSSSLFYPSSIKVHAPKKGLELRISASDFVKSKD